MVIVENLDSRMEKAVNKSSDKKNINTRINVGTLYQQKEDYRTAFEYISEAESIDNKEEYRIMYKELAKLANKNCC